MVEHELNSQAVDLRPGLEIDEQKLSGAPACAPVCPWRAVLSTRPRFSLDTVPATSEASFLDLAIAETESVAQGTARES